MTTPKGRGFSDRNELGTKPDLARGHLLSAELSAAQGRREEALECLATAETMFAAMGMEGSFAEAERLQRELIGGRHKS
jgi:hypothetical protein